MDNSLLRRVCEKKKDAFTFYFYFRSIVRLKHLNVPYRCHSEMWLAIRRVCLVLLFKYYSLRVARYTKTHYNSNVFAVSLLGNNWNIAVERVGPARPSLNNSSIVAYRILLHVNQNTTFFFTESKQNATSSDTFSKFTLLDNRSYDIMTRINNIIVTKNNVIVDIGNKSKWLRPLLLSVHVYIHS